LRTSDGEDRAAILSALPRLSPAILPPLLAGLESNDPRLQIELIGVLQQRAEKQAVPWLWYLSASPRQSPEVRQAAPRAIAFLLETPAERLPQAKVGLTQEAERYYQHQVSFPDPRAVVVWRWDANSQPAIVSGWPQSPTVSASQAEEYYGNHFAKQ